MKNGAIVYSKNTLIVTISNDVYNPGWYNAQTIISVDDISGLTITTEGTHIVRDSRLGTYISDVERQFNPDNLENIIKEYLGIMGGDSICYFHPNPYYYLYIRKSNGRDNYYLTDSYGSAVYYDASKIQELWGVSEHNDIKIPHFDTSQSLSQRQSHKI